MIKYTIVYFVGEIPDDDEVEDCYIAFYDSLGISKHLLRLGSPKLELIITMICTIGRWFFATIIRSRPLQNPPRECFHVFSKSAFLSWAQPCQGLLWILYNSSTTVCLCETDYEVFDYDTGRCIVYTTLWLHSPCNCRRRWHYYFSI